MSESKKPFLSIYLLQCNSRFVGSKEDGKGLSFVEAFDHFLAIPWALSHTRTQ